MMKLIFSAFLMVSFLASSSGGRVNTTTVKEFENMRAMMQRMEATIRDRQTKIEAMEAQISALTDKISKQEETGKNSTMAGLAGEAQSQKKAWVSCGEIDW